MDQNDAVAFVIKVYDGAAAGTHIGELLLYRSPLSLFQNGISANSNDQCFCHGFLSFSVGYRP